MIVDLLREGDRVSQILGDWRILGVGELLRSRRRALNTKRRIVLSAFLLVVTLFGSAEEPPPPPMKQAPPIIGGPRPPRVTFDQGKVVTIKDFSTSKPMVTVREPGAPAPVPVAGFSGLLPNSLNFHQGRFWALALPREKPEQPTFEFRSSPDGQSWKTQGVFTRATSKFAPQVALPLGNGNVLCLHQNAVGDPEPTSWFALYGRNEKGVYSFLAESEMGLKVPLMKRMAEPGGRSSWAYNPALHVIAGTSYEWTGGIVSTGSYLIFVHATSGLCWVFDAENGRLKRVAPLYPEVMDRLDNLSAIETVFLAWQADESGRILMASRSEDAVFGARKLTAAAVAKLKPPQSPSGTSPEEMAALKAQLEEYRQRLFEAVKVGFTTYPLLRWWSFDPETGKYEPTTAPEGAPASLSDVKDLETLVLEPVPGGGKRLAHPAPAADPAPSVSKSKASTSSPEAPKAINGPPPAAKLVAPPSAPVQSPAAQDAPAGAAKGSKPPNT